MGHEVEKIALQRDHEILARIDNEEDWTSFKNSEIAPCTFAKCLRYDE